jgi:hypothetical protein
MSLVMNGKCCHCFAILTQIRDDTLPGVRPDSRVETMIPERFCPRQVPCHHSSSIFGIIDEKDSMIQLVNDLPCEQVLPFRWSICPEC